MTQLKKDWWLGIAALIAGLYLVMGAGIWIDKLVADTTSVNGVEVELPGQALLDGGAILLTIVLIGATGAIATGVFLRNRRPAGARRLIVAGVLPSALIGVVFYWFPPFWVVSSAAIAVLVRAGRGAARHTVPA